MQEVSAEKNNSNANMGKLKQDLMRLIKHFKAPPTAVPHNFENETGIAAQMAVSDDTFAF